VLRSSSGPRRGGPLLENRARRTVPPGSKAAWPTITPACGLQNGLSVNPDVPCSAGRASLALERQPVASQGAFRALS